jgi:uncharacterized protein
MKDKKADSSRDSTGGARTTPPEASGRGPGERAPLDETKPPRQWRVSRVPEGRAVPAPRVVKFVSAEEAAPPAGSAVPATETAVTSVPPQAPVAAPIAAPPLDLPARYGVDRLVILVRDPWWVYAWWELTDGNLSEGKRVLGSSGDLVLRMYDVSAIDWDGSNHHSHFDIEIGDLAGNWYIEIGRPGASFVAEIGLRAPDGRFVALLRSNFVTLPRDGMSPVVDEEWMVVEEDYRVLFELAGGGSIGLGSGEIQRLLEQRLRAELASGGVGSFGISSVTARTRNS